MSDFTTMILVLGGTFAVGAALLYFSVMTGPRRTDASKRSAAIETTAAMAAMQDPDSGSK
jgi:hypothetical protein